VGHRRNKELSSWNLMKMKAKLTETMGHKSYCEVYIRECTYEKHRKLSNR
jgi:hypothetical protein